MLTGIAFGPESGFIVGAVTAFASNFFYGQGAYLPWQMIAYGAGGMLAGFVFIRNKKRNPWVMAIFGFFANVLWIGPILDTSHVFVMLSEFSFDAFAASLAAGLPVNLSQGICTALMMLVFGIASGFFDCNLYAGLFEVVAPRYRAAAMGVYLCGAFLIGCPATAVLGWVGQNFSLQHGIAMFAGTYALGAIAMFIARAKFFNRDKVEL
jgi:uncharacterized membrane protein